LDFLGGVGVDGCGCVCYDLHLSRWDHKTFSCDDSFRFHLVLVSRWRHLYLILSISTICNITSLDFPHLFFYHTLLVLVIGDSEIPSCHQDISDQNLWNFSSPSFYIYSCFVRIKERVWLWSHRVRDEIDTGHQPVWILNRPITRVCLYEGECLWYPHPHTLKQLYLFTLFQPLWINLISCFLKKKYLFEMNYYFFNSQSRETQKNFT
jgi:hypothetical protein